MSTSSDQAVQEFISLFVRNQARLKRYVLVLLPDLSAADDIIQETALTLWSRFSEFKPGTSFYAWACRTAYLKTLEHRRRHDVRQTILDPDVIENLAAELSTQTGLMEARTAALQGCLRRLRPRDRELVERRYLRGEKGLEIALDLGRSANSVYQSLGRIRRALLACVTSALTTGRVEGETA